MLTNFGARVIIFLTSLPVIAALISLFSSANFSRSESEIFGDASMRSLIFPLICKIAVTASAFNNASSIFGQPARANPALYRWGCQLTPLRSEASKGNSVSLHLSHIGARSSALGRRPAISPPSPPPSRGRVGRGEPIRPCRIADLLRLP